MSTEKTTTEKLRDTKQSEEFSTYDEKAPKPRKKFFADHATKNLQQNDDKNVFDKNGVRNSTNFRMAQILSSSSSKNFGHGNANPILNFKSSRKDNSKTGCRKSKSKSRSKPFKKAKLIAIVTGRRSEKNSSNLRL